MKHILFKPLQEYIVFLAKFYIFNDCIAIFIYSADHRDIIYNANSNHQIVGIVVRHKHVQVTSVLIRNLCCNFIHLDLFIDHDNLIQFNSEYPWRETAEIFFGLFSNLIVLLHKLTIHRDDRVHRVWVIVYFSEFGNIPKDSVLN